MHSPTNLSPAQMHWNIIDGVLAGWENMREHRDLLGIETWDLIAFTQRVFPGWEAIAVLREENAAAVCVRRDDLLFAIPLYWPENGYPKSREDADDDPDEVDGLVVADHDDTISQWREAVFDSGLTDSVHGTGLMEVVDMLLEDEIVVTRNSRLSALLCVEAVLLAASEEERAAMRTLLGLRGVAQRTGFQRLL